MGGRERKGRKNEERYFALSKGGILEEDNGMAKTRRYLKSNE